MFTQLKVYVAIAALLAAVSGSFFYGQHTQKLADDEVFNKERVALQQKIDTEQQRREEISSKFETKLDNIKVVNTTINKTVKQELQKQIYTDCKLPDTGVDLINSNADQLNAVRHGTASAPVAASQ
jgi:hypothetical protein